MKTTVIATLSAAVALSALPAFAGIEPTDRDRTEAAVRADVPGHRLHRELLGPVMKGSKLLGTPVKNSQDERLGKVDELAVDLETGRIVQVILSVGGVLGVGDRLVAVPPASFATDGDQKVYLNVDKAKLKSAAEFDLTRWDENMQPAQVSRVYADYGAVPYFHDLGQPDSIATTSAERISHPEKASKLIGLTVKNNQGETVGKVNNLLVDLAAGRVVQVVVSAGGFLGIGDELNFVPPAAFRYNPERDALLLDVTRESLSQAPRFRNGEWPAPSDRSRFADVYRYYHVEPYFSTNAPDADNTGRNVRDRNNLNLTPLDQGTSDADITLTRNIRMAIRDTDGLSVNAQNVKVITRGGRVTLRGAVNNDAEKNKLADIAGRYATAGDIDNQLEVKGANPDPNP